MTRNSRAWSKRLFLDGRKAYFCTMNTSLLNYKALITGGIISIVLTLVLIGTEVNPINPAYVSINIFIFVFWWVLLTILIYKTPIYKVLGLLSVLVITILLTNYMQIPNNPLTFPLMILFWLGIAYLILPQFFEKYKTAILLVYGVILFYFFIVRMAPNYREVHHLNVLNAAFIPLPIFVALWVYEEWYWMTALKADKAKAELALLKSQINPHFFFNTLNNLYGLVVEKSDKAPEVVLKLSDMMRYTIYEGKEDLVLLKDEVSYLENYIELHKIRYQKKVEIVFTHQVEGGLKVAPLLFIILLENAFKHGVEKMRKNAFIHLHMQSQGTQLFFKIENNFDEQASRHKPGIGLKNLKKRLAYSYPDQHELVVEAKESVYKVYLNLDLL